MKRFLISSTILVTLFFVLALPLPPSPVQGQAPPTENLTDECVSEFDETVDYFPEKVTVSYAEGFTVTYAGHYKTVAVDLPTGESFEYILVQCGTPTPEDTGDATVIEIPVADTIALSTSQLPHLTELGVVDHLVGIDSFLYTNSPEVVDRIEAGEVIEIGFSSDLNVELVLDAEPDIVFSDGFGDVHSVLADTGVPVAINGEWAEALPLGRAEWIKFTALLYNEEATATEVFEEIATEYEDLVALTADLPEDEKPSVLYGTYLSFTEAWNIPGSETYTAQLFRDAGARMVLEDADEVRGQRGSIPFDFEVVYDAGLEADYWIPDAFGVTSLDDLLAQDDTLQPADLYSDFEAVDAGNIYNTSGRVNASGGNDYYESGVLYANVELADYISIFHPELLPDHDL
ncbi:MAG: ABC transporter substrate-binding protein, partial [Chloroflexi bacterium]|nr:ABC transporter substrate-binding protein [Chloroflexota bacterium]